MVLEKQISELEYFRTVGGKVLPSILALRAYLRTIPTAEYNVHVELQRNDFAAWIEHTYAEKKLADKMRACVSREQMVWVLDDAFAEARMSAVLKNVPVPSLSSPKVADSPDTQDPMPMQEDETFELIKPELVARNEAIGKKYEDIAKQMQEALTDPMPKQFEQLSEQLRTRYSDLMLKISEARRAGRDVLVPSLVLHQFTPKLNLARVTREAQDFELARIILDEAQFELRQVLEEKVMDVKAEVLALAQAK